MREFPRYGFVGLALMVASEAGMLLRIEPFWTWHTPTAWTGYILFVDAWVWRLRGDSWLMSSPREFAFLALASVPLWLVFEFYNLFIRNWHYVNLPEPPLRYAGYAWSFATIWPAIFETGDLMGALRGSIRPAGAVRAPSRWPLSVRQRLSIAAGAAMLVWPIVWPSPYLAAPIWLGFILLLDPLNAWRGGEALVADARRGSSDRLINLCAAGLLCGVVWEFWNFWARAKWIYTVPIMPELKLFEMPLVGYLGFPAFAIECFTMYVALRLLIWRGPVRAISL